MDEFAYLTTLTASYTLKKLLKNVQASCHNVDEHFLIELANDLTKVSIFLENTKEF